MDNKFNKINSFIIEKMQSSNLPALSLAIYQDGDIIYSRGYGRKNLSTGEPASSNTLYGIGSITKSFVCLAIMQLHEKGKLNITDGIDKYLSFNIKPFGETITVEDLMKHTSGIPSLGYASVVLYKSSGGKVNDIPIGTSQDMIDYMNKADKWVEVKPGSKWFYSNEGYVLLGGIIEKVSGQKFSDYITTNILKPLQMNNTIFSRESFSKHEDTAQPYLINSDGERIPFPYLYGNVYSDGNIISNVLDLIKYIKLYLNEKPDIIDKKSLNNMMKPHIPLPSQKIYSKKQGNVSVNFNTGESIDYYGYGLINTPDFYGHKKIGHGGSMLVSTGQIDFIPQKDIGVALLANGSGYPLKNISKYILAQLLGEDPISLAFREAEIKENIITGLYTAYEESLTAKVTRKGDFLNCQIGFENMKNDIILIPENFNDTNLKYFTLENGKKMPAEFNIKNNKVEFIFGRNKYCKA